MTPAEVFDVVRDAVATVLEIEPDAVTRDASLVEDLGADSLALVEIVEIVEEQLRARSPGFVVGDDDIDLLVTVGDAVDYAVARL